MTGRFIKDWGKGRAGSTRSSFSLYPPKGSVIPSPHTNLHTRFYDNHEYITLQFRMKNGLAIIKVLYQYDFMQKSLETMQ
jgi:hypothetical protein